MGLKALLYFSPPSAKYVPNPMPTYSSTINIRRAGAGAGATVVSVRAQGGENDQKNEEETKPKNEQSLFGSVMEALDFSQVRSEKDAELIQEAREATKSGDKMTREQYGALRRKIGGTYKDFFKSYVEVDGKYVEEGWVDKTCKVCKKDTKNEPRQVDKLGRYVHVACLNNKSQSSNFFTKLFSF